MVVKNWATGVNTKALRDTNWKNVVGFISDETRSGKTKRRANHSQARRPFNVTIMLTTDEYDNFNTWYNNTINKGLYAFYFPRIDSTDKTIMRAYRFAEEGAPSFSNPSGKIIKATMQWEEV